MSETRKRILQHKTNGSFIHTAKLTEAEFGKHLEQYPEVGTDYLEITQEQFHATDEIKALAAKKLLDGKLRVVEAHMDSVANSPAYGYDNIRSAVDYFNSKHAKFGPEGRAFTQWRDDCWDAGFVLLNAWEQGGAEPSDESVIAAMPELVVDYDA